MLFLVSLSFFQFYFADIKTFFGIEGDAGSLISLTFIATLGFLTTIFSRWVEFRIFFVVLLIANICYSSLGFFSVDYNSYLEPTSSEAVQDEEFDKAIAPLSRSPNIFYIVPDGLASPRVLQEYAGIDIDVSVGSLRDSGFSVLEHAYSAYNITYLTFASLFEMALPVTEVSEKYNDRSKFYPKIRDKKPALLQYLKANNYRFVVVPPKWGGCPSDKAYHCLVPSVSKGKFLNHFIHDDYAISTMLSDSLLIRLLPRPSPHSGMNDASKTAIDHMKKNPSFWSNGGLFTMIHMFIPHEPHRNSDCSLITSDTKRRAKGTYKSSALCAIGRINEISQFIIKNFPEASIVVQSDHGVSVDGFDDSLPFAELPYHYVDSRLSMYSAVRGCKSDQAVKQNQVNIIRFMVECVTAKARSTEFTNRSFFGFYQEHPEYGRVFSVEKKQ